jgi:hypothetical protein
MYLQLHKYFDGRALRHSSMGLQTATTHDYPHPCEHDFTETQSLYCYNDLRDY